MGTAYLKLGDFPNAERNYLKAIDEDKLYYKGYYNLAYCYSIQKKWADAEEYYKKSIQVYDKEPKVWMALATAQYQQQKDEEALNSLRQAMHIAPDDLGVKQAYDRFYQYIQDRKSGKPSTP
jgi:tetratricopeptide (TPR) repeat protein